MNPNIFDGLDQDPMTELLASSSRETPAAPSGHTETCEKCRGSGNFVGYSGRIVGRCFTCNGTGQRIFTTSRETRARAAVSRERRREEAGAENLSLFKTSHPDLWGWMEGNEFSFAKSMVEAVTKYGSLTEGQERAVRNCIASDARRAIAEEERQQRQVERQTADRAASVQVDASAIEAALRRALQNSRRPRLSINGLRFQFAPTTSRNAGSIYVTNANRVFLGRISEGRFLPRSYVCTPEQVEQVRSIAEDPRSAAVAHGFRTGSCACCGRTLTDPESVRIGIGPICLSHYGW